MVSNSTAILAIFCLVGCAHAQFVLTDPPSIEYIENAETIAPCGDFGVDLKSEETTEFFSDGGHIGVDSVQGDASWLFRITTHNSAEHGWDQIYPVFNTTGEGRYCTTSIKVPQKYIGKKAIIQVAALSDVDRLFQCSAVKIVEGIGPPGEMCINDTSITSVYSPDTKVLFTITNADSVGVSLYAQMDSKIILVALTVTAMTLARVAWIF